MLQEAALHRGAVSHWEFPRVAPLKGAPAAGTRAAEKDAAPRLLRPQTSAGSGLRAAPVGKSWTSRASCT